MKLFDGRCVPQRRVSEVHDLAVCSHPTELTINRDAVKGTSITLFCVNLALRII